MTYREIVSSLQSVGIESAPHEAAELISHFYPSVSSPALSPDLDYSLPALAAAVEKRRSRYPLQYILGEWDFYRQRYEVSPDCLIPRSDTERLVEEAIRLLPPSAAFADLCTGSGCIAISTLCERPDTSAVAVEKFSNTLALAVRNAARNGVSDRFSPLLGDVLSNSILPQGSLFDAILSNPPYIRTAVIDGLAPELFCEPRAALDGGEDGLIFYRRILENGARHLKPNGFFLFEIGFDQADALRRIGASLGFSEIHVMRDYGGNDRVVFLKK